MLNSLLFSSHNSIPFYIGSLLLHFLFFFNIFFNFNKTEIQPTPSIIVPSFSQHEVKNISRNNSIPIKVTSKKIVSHEKKESVLANQNHKINKNKLLILLHQAIQNAQEYPENAIYLRREGTTTIQFILSPNGIISNLNMTKSSGTLALDQAAIRAVRSANYQSVISYLHQSEEFSVDVEFKL